MEMNHILVVEDDKEIREGVKIYLQSQGYEVFLAADGIEGLEVMEKEDIHLAIVDIMMPRMDGIRMTMKLREKYDFPVIMLSAKSEEVDKIMGLNIGADLRSCVNAGWSLQQNRAYLHLSSVRIKR